MFAAAPIFRSQLRGTSTGKDYLYSRTGRPVPYTRVSLITAWRYLVRVASIALVTHHRYGYNR